MTSAGLRIEPDRQNPVGSSGRQRADSIDGGEVERRDQHVVGCARRAGGEEIDHRLGRTRVGILDLDVHEPAAADVEHRGQARDVGQRPGEVGGGDVADPADRGLRIVADNQDVVDGAVNVELDAVRTRSTASLIAGTVFSGATRLAPRCASTSIRSPCHALAEESRKFLVSPLRAGAGEISLGFKRLEARPGTRQYGHIT